jgi:uncharacterized membrane protein (Fun14 family)
MSLTSPKSTSEEAPAREPLPVWKKLAFTLALLLGLSGLALTRTNAHEAQPASQGGASGLDAGAASFGPGGAQLGAAPEDESLWAPLAMKGGLAFAIAFAIGFALRTFMALTMVVMGVVALAIFGLQKAGIVGEIDWNVAEGHWDALTANVGRQFESFKTFVSGSLPSAGAGTVGLVSGFRR